MRTMPKAVALTTACVAALQLAACAPALKSYPDPAFHKASYQDLKPVARATPVRVDVQFQREGAPVAAADLALRRNVERTLKASGVFLPDQMATSTVRVVVNNVVDRSAARSAGITTGLTFGLSGGMVTDQYLFDIAYTVPGSAKKDGTYRHVMHTAVGGIDLPPGFVALTPDAAYGKVVEDAVLNFVQQYQADQLALR